MRCSCVATNCSHQHQCNYCKHWLSPSAFGIKAAARKKCCMKCSEKKKVHNAKSNPKKVLSNAKNNAKTSAANLAKAIEYEEKTAGDKIDLTDERRAVAEQQCIETIKARIKVREEQYPKGFFLAIYGTSEGSLTVEHEGRNQFTERGYGKPPIVDAYEKAISVTLTGPYGPGGEAVFECGPSKVLSSVVEKAAQEYFTPICDASGHMMPRLWRVPGAGFPKGTGPYTVCIRIMPLPLPLGWHRSASRHWA